MTSEVKASAHTRTNPPPHPPTTGETAELLALVRRRVGERLLPGCMDAKKDGDGMVGDFFVWGRVEAAAVYDICTYDDGRSLRGFTKPVKRISGNPHERGLLPDTAAEYRNGPGRASGFRIRPRLVPLLNEATDDDES